MTDYQLMYRRRFDWFNLVYPLLVVGGFYWVFSRYGDQPFRTPVFWGITVLILGGQVFYFFRRSKSPTELAVDGDEFVIKWGERESRLPAHHLRLDESSGNSNSQVLWCSGERIRVFADSSTINKILKTVRARELAALPQDEP